MKRYTLEEANALLPYLAPTLVELREKFEEASKIRQELARAAAANGGSQDRDDWAKTLARVDELLDRLREWELELRDIDTGLVDFPALVEGQEAYLCWRLGEPDVAWWHSVEDGFQGRRRL